MWVKLETKFPQTETINPEGELIGKPFPLIRIYIPPAKLPCFGYTLEKIRGIFYETLVLA